MHSLVQLLFIALLGAIIGSFIGALTFRLPMGISIQKGRSFCPKCKKQIAWYDNVPIFSFILLQGKCRECGKSISPRYPLIEVSCSILFMVSFYFYTNILANLPWIIPLGSFGYIIVFFLMAIFTAIFVVDTEHQIIPDQFTFVGISVVLTALILSGNNVFWLNLLSGSVASAFLLILHLATNGRGMGLGDVKLAILAGLILGPAITFFWLLSAFVLGSIVGIALVAYSKANLKSKIAFGPFLVMSAVFMFFFGNIFSSLLFPFW